MSVRAVLLAGGLGTRLRPLTNTVPKCLIPVGGRPILDYWLDALDRAGIRNVLLNTHHHATQVQSYIHKVNARGSVHLDEAYEPTLLGSAGTIHANQEWVEDADEVIIIYADNLSDINLNTFLQFHRTHDEPVSMALFQTPHPKSCGIATLDCDQLVTSFIEKPAHPASNLANAGLYILDAVAWREIADMDVFDFGFDVIPAFVNRMRGFTHSGYHLDIGTHAALEQANQDAKGLFL